MASAKYLVILLAVALLFAGWMSNDCDAYPTGFTGRHGEHSPEDILGHHQQQQQQDKRHPRSADPTKPTKSKGPEEKS